MTGDKEEEWQCGAVCPLFGGPCWSNTYYHIKCGNIKIKTKESKSNPLLFADDIWPGAVITADYLANNSDEYCCGKRVLELGAGASLPSLVCGKLRCDKLVISDYPDDNILNNIKELIIENELMTSCEDISVRGHIWGEDVEMLLKDDDKSSTMVLNTDQEVLNNNKFDTIILAELLWKDTYSLHNSLLLSVVKCLKPSTGRVLVGFAHRPVDGIHSVDNDLEFFELAEKNYNLSIKLLETRELNDPFSSDNGLIQVYLYELYYDK